MPRKIWIALGILVAFFVTDFVASSYTLGYQAARPFTLAKGEAEVPVWQPVIMGEEQPDGTARSQGADGVPFGYAFTYALPKGGTVRCTHVLQWIWCDEGWEAHRS